MARSQNDQTASDQPKDDASKRVQAASDEAHEKGYIGVSPDPTPRANYTVAGVTAGAPTPETDEQAKADALDPKKVR